MDTAVPIFNVIVYGQHGSVDVDVPGTGSKVMSPGPNDILGR